MEKKSLNAQEAKKEFVTSIHNWIMETLDRNGKSEYKRCFQKETDSSIICYLPTDYFNLYDIPEGVKIEMKFTCKKG